MFSAEKSYWYDKKLYSLSWFLILALLLMVAPPVLADEAEEGSEEESAATEEAGKQEQMSFFGKTTVTATGTEVDTFDIPEPVIVISADRIQEIQPDNASDLLRSEPGVDVNGIGPNQMRPIIRGQRGLRILFLENGLRLNNARRQTDFGEITGLVDVAHVERMEVVRGAGSVLYGSDAIGGVLNLITTVPPVGTGSHVGGFLGLRYSTADDQTKESAGISGYSDDFSYYIAGTLRDAEDYEAPDGSFGDIDLANDTVVNDTGLEDDTVNSYFGYRVNDRQSLFFRYNRYRADQSGFGFVDPDVIEDPSGFRIRILYPFQDFDRYTLGYSASALQSKAVTTADVQIYLQENERQLANDIFIDIGMPFGLPSDVTADTLNFTDLETFGGRAELTKAVGSKHLVTYGAEYFEDDSFNTDSSVTTTTLRAPFPLDFICGQAGAIPFPFQCVIVETDDVANAPNATNTGYGVFVQDTAYATDRFTATFGLRYAKSETNAEPTPGWDITGLDFDDDQVVGALHLTYGVSDNVNLVGSYATAFRAPNIIERLFNGLTPEGAGFQVLNADLASEESDTIDVGIKFRSRRAFLEAIYFDNEIDNAIVQHTLSEEEISELPPDVQDEIQQSGVQFVVQQRNADVLTIDGVEVTGGYRLDNGLSLGGNYTHLSGESRSGGPAADPTGDTFSDKYNGYLRYDQRRGRYWVEYRVRHNGEEDVIIDPGALPGPLGEVLPSFTVHTLAAGVTVYEKGSQHHMLGLVVENLTDELYAEFSNATFFRPQAERSFIATYRLRFK